MELAKIVSTEGELQQNDHPSNQENPTDNAIPEVSDETRSRQSNNDSIYPSSVDSELLRFGKESLAAVEGNRKLAPYRPVWIVTNEGETQNLNSGNIVGTDANPKGGKLPILHINSVFPSDTEVSSEGGYESLESLAPWPKDDCSEFEPFNGREILKPTIEEPDMALIDSLHAHDSWGSENDSDVPKGRIKPPIVVSWKEPPVDEVRISASASRPPISDITDLGDRQFYADFNATGRRLSVPFTFHNHLEDRALQNLYFKALVGFHENKKGFFPRALLSTLVTEECVVRELTRCLEKNQYDDIHIKQYAKTICEEAPQDPLPRCDNSTRLPKIKSFKKIFVILVLIEATSSIIDFLKEDINDSLLPLIKVWEVPNDPLFDLRLSRMPDKTLACFQDWTHFKLRAFEEWQWTTISPFFYKGTRKEVHHFPLQNSVILPFTTDSRRDPGIEIRTDLEGGYGCVFMVDIHPDHHNFVLPKKQKFAIKRLHSPNREDFDKEVEMLKMFSDNAHPNLISLLATYEQSGAYFLVFPRAEGDLTRFWKVLEPKPSFSLRIKWVAKQSEGIAQGLVKIHKYQISHSKLTADSHEKRYGRHGDLKPENILLFDDEDGRTLKISDFGLAEYSTNHSKSYKRKSTVATSMSYRPPETDLEGGQIGQSYDIWTLGCLYLEFITWLLGGWELVKKFELERYSVDPGWYNCKTDVFFEIVKDHKKTGMPSVHARVKPAVKECMARLHAHQSCSEFLHEFINMVELDMLIVKPINQEGTRRIASEEVCSKLVGMLKKCENVDYALKPAPWPYHPRYPNDSTNTVKADPTNLAVKTPQGMRVLCDAGRTREQLHPDMLEIPNMRSSIRH